MRTASSPPEEYSKHHNTMVLSIITLVIAIVALAVAAVDYLKFKKYDNVLDGLQKEGKSLNNLYHGLEERIDDLDRQEIVFPNLEGVVYDEKTSTMTVKGNIKADGWIASGKVNTED